MSAEKLREFLTHLGLSQADFARLIGATPRAVALWLAGDRGIPGSVEAYARLLSQSTPSAIQQELLRLKASKKSMRDGMYLVTYQTMNVADNNAGFAFLTLDAGKVFGADPVGGKYDGEYLFDEQTGDAELRLKVTFPPNVPAVFGVCNPYEWSIQVALTIHSDLESGATVVQTFVGGPIQVQYKFMRALPEWLAA